MADGVAKTRSAGDIVGKTSGRKKSANSEGNAGNGRLVRIIVADDRRLCRECVKLLIETIDPRLEVVEASGVEQIGPLLEQGKGRSVVLYNLAMADQKGLDFIEALGRSLGEIPLVVMCDTSSNELTRGALERGAKAFLPSSTPGPVMIAILHLVIAGGTYVPPILVTGASATEQAARGRAREKERREQVIAKYFPALTPRQRHVLALLSQGLSNRDIASTLDMCENTVKAHVKQVMRKLNAENRTQAALMADRLTA